MDEDKKDEETPEKKSFIADVIKWPEGFYSCAMVHSGPYDPMLPSEVTMMVENSMAKAGHKKDEVSLKYRIFEVSKVEIKDEIK